MPKQKKTTGTPRKQFSYTTTEGTAIALVFDYLHARLGGGFSYREGKERAADALLAFWKPYAAQASGQYSQAELQEMARRAVEVLVRQIGGICQDFEIENPLGQISQATDESGQEFQEALAQQLQDLVTSLQAQLQSGDGANEGTTADLARSGSSTVHEEFGVHVDDDELLGDYSA